MKQSTRGVIETGEGEGVDHIMEATGGNKTALMMIHLMMSRIIGQVISFMGETTTSTIRTIITTTKAMVTPNSGLRTESLFIYLFNIN